MKEWLKWRRILVDKPPEKVFLFYTQHQPIYDELVAQNLVDGLFYGTPTLEELDTLCSPFRFGNGSAVIFDDQLSALARGASADSFSHDLAQFATIKSNVKKIMRKGLL